MNSVLKVYNNFSKEYFSNRKINEERYDALFQKSEIYLEAIQKKLSELNLWSNTVVLVISDHGISTGEKFGERAYGAFCYDYTIKTFAYYISPDFLPQKINQQVRHIDFMPTILDHFQISQNPSAEKFDGVSLLPLINGGDFSETTAYTETGNPLNNKAPPKKPNIKSIRTSTWKLIFNEYDGTKELYNLKSDPEEKHNLISQDLEIEIDLWEKLVEHI
jgi:arylsulfatase A-like enzyme